MCVRFFPRIAVPAAAAADCIVRQPVVLDFCVRARARVCGSASINYYYCLFCWSVFFFFTLFIIIFFRLVLSAGQLKRVLNEPIRITLLLLLLVCIIVITAVALSARANVSRSAARPLLISGVIVRRWGFRCRIPVIV